MKKSESFKLASMEMHKENPFVKQALVQIGSAIVSKRVTGANNDEGAILKAVDGEGQILGNTVFMRNKTVDNEEFVKFFLKGFRAFFDLKPVSIKVFKFILDQLKPNSDEFLFFIEDCIKETGYSQASIYRALGELCGSNIIARGRTEELFYINPMVIFNGDRITFATTYINKNYPKFHTSKGHLKGTIDVMSQEKILPSYPTMDEALFPDGVNPVK